LQQADSNLTNLSYASLNSNMKRSLISVPWW